MTYNEFRIKFINYAITGKIARNRQFKNVCKKVSADLKRNLCIKKYKINGDYITLNEFLAIANRESRNISAKKKLVNCKQAALIVTFKLTRG